MSKNQAFSRSDCVVSDRSSTISWMATASSEEISSRTQGSSSKPSKNALSFWAIKAKFRWATLRSLVWPSNTQGNDAISTETLGTVLRPRNPATKNPLSGPTRRDPSVIQGRSKRRPVQCPLMKCWQTSLFCHLGAINAVGDPTGACQESPQGDVLIQDGLKGGKRRLFKSV